MSITLSKLYQSQSWVKSPMQRAICKVHGVCPYAERFKSIPYDVPLGYDAYVDNTAAKVLQQSC